jgi:hypothetical protein
MKKEEVTSRIYDCGVKIEIGDIFRSSWGYGQTNVDFYQVVGLTPKSVKLRMIQSKVEQTGAMSGQALPIKDAFYDWRSEMRGTDGVMTKKVKAYRNNKNQAEAYISISSFSGAWKWDGQPSYTSWEY